jgi:hypothetical protein
LGLVIPATDDEALVRILRVPLCSEGGEVAIEVVRMDDHPVRLPIQGQQVVPNPDATWENSSRTSENLGSFKSQTGPSGYQGIVEHGGEGGGQCD